LASPALVGGIQVLLQGPSEIGSVSRVDTSLK